MMFEGSEKKCELLVNEAQIDLRSLSRDFWWKVVDKCEATILSTVQTTGCDAYLLSESSLFVWSNRLLLITCGRTKLVHSILFLLSQLPKNSVYKLLFQRQNEYFSHLQDTSFTQDVQLLSRVVSGKVTVLGSVNSHYAQVFGMGSVDSKSEEHIYELSMYAISDERSRQLSDPDVTKEQLRALFGFSWLLPGAVIDDHLFEPHGYSVNALCDGKYLIIHVTPEVEASYIGLKSNRPLTDWMAHLLPTFRPASFDVIVSNPLENYDLLEQVPKSYRCVQSQRQYICGEWVHFVHCDFDPEMNDVEARYE